MNIKNISRILDNDTLATLAPSVFATKPADHVSEDYKFVNTGEVLNTLRNEGWGPVFAVQQKVRIPSRSTGTKHLVLLRQNDSKAESMGLGGLIPTMQLVNSHDWSSRFEASFGMYRLVCGNGLIASGAEFASFSIRHDTVAEDINKVLGRFNSYSTKMLERADKWMQIHVTQALMNQYAMEAARIRFGEEAGSDHAASLLTIRRPEDQGMNLWSLYNTVQENALKGGNKQGGMKRRSRELTNIGKSVEVNSQLFALTDQYASMV
jgi:hypothetical protein